MLEIGLAAAEQNIIQGERDVAKLRQDVKKNPSKPMQVLLEARERELAGSYAARDDFREKLKKDEDEKKPDSETSWVRRLWITMKLLAQRLTSRGRS